MKLRGSDIYNTHSVADCDNKGRLIYVILSYHYVILN